MKLPHKYVAVDIETTDSDFTKGEIIQIGAIVINEDFTTGPVFNSFMHPTTEWRNPEATAVHNIPESILANAPFPHAVLRAFANFCTIHTESRSILAAWGAYFDIPYLEHSYKYHGIKYPFSYKSLDLKSIAIFECARTGMDSSGGLAQFADRLEIPFEGVAHDALSDIKTSVAIINELIKRHEK